MCEPLSIIVNAASAIKAVYQVSTALYGFVHGTAVVDESIQGLMDELDSLKNGIVSIETCLRSPALRGPQKAMADGNSQDLFMSLEGALKNCEDTLQKFEEVLLKVKGNHSARNPFRQPMIQLKLDINANEIVLYRRQISIHASAMQLGLQTITLYASLQGPELVINTLSPKIDVLVDLMAEFHPQRYNQQIPQALDIEPPRIAETTTRLKEAAEKVVSSARSAVSSGSTVCGGSVYSYQELGMQQRAGISQWTLDAVAEGAGEDPSTQRESTTLVDSDSEEDVDLEMFDLLAEEGESLLGDGKINEAEGFYRNALQAASKTSLRIRSTHKHNGAILKLAVIHIEQKKYEEAKEVLSQLLSKSKVDLPPKEAEQMIEGTHTLAKAHLELKELSEAERCCKQAMLARRRTLGKDSPAYHESLKLLVAICVANGQTELATGYRGMLPKEASKETHTERTTPRRTANHRNQLSLPSNAPMLGTPEIPLLKGDKIQKGHLSPPQPDSLRRKSLDLSQTKPADLKESDNTLLLPKSRPRIAHSLATTPSSRALLATTTVPIRTNAPTDNGHVQRSRSPSSTPIGSRVNTTLPSPSTTTIGTPPTANTSDGDSPISTFQFKTYFDPTFYETSFTPNQSSPPVPKTDDKSPTEAAKKKKPGSEPLLNEPAAPPPVPYRAKKPNLDSSEQAGDEKSGSKRPVGWIDPPISNTSITQSLGLNASVVVPKGLLDLSDETTYNIRNFTFDPHTALLQAIERADLEVVWVLMYRLSDVKNLWLESMPKTRFIDKIFVTQRSLKPFAAQIDVNYKDSKGPLLFHACAYRATPEIPWIRRCEIINLLLEFGLAVDIIRAGATPLLRASSQGRYGVMDILVKCGADVNRKDSNGHTPLYLVLQRSTYGAEKAACMLVEHGAYPNTQVDDERNTALSKVASLGWKRATSIFIKHGADIEFSLNDATETPLGAAASRGHDAIVQLLLAKGAKTETKTAGAGQPVTPLYLAAKNGHNQAVRLLLSHGANIEARSRRGTPLHLAAYCGHLQVVETLIEKGADIEASWDRGSTPLCAAVRAGQYAVVKKLLDRGAEVNHAIHGGRTALDLAVQYKHVAVEKLLKDQGGAESRRESRKASA